MKDKIPIRSFKDLDVYQNAYKGMLSVHHDVLPKLPASEKFDLRDQLSRSTKAVPRLIAEGYGKRHQKAGFQKYIDDGMGECNETVVGLEQCRDLYGVDTRDLVKLYDMIGRQLYRLREAWNNFKTQKTK